MIEFDEMRHVTKHRSRIFYSTALINQSFISIQMAVRLIWLSFLSSILFNSEWHLQWGISESYAIFLDQTVNLMKSRNFSRLKSTDNNSLCGDFYFWTDKMFFGRKNRRDFDYKQIFVALFFLSL